MTRRALLVEDDVSIATVITAALEDEPRPSQSDIGLPMIENIVSSAPLS